jgi:hypothetical protein
MIGVGQSMTKDGEAIADAAGVAPGSVGAAKAPRADFFLDDDKLASIHNGDTPESALNSKFIRVDSAAQIDRSGIPLARALGNVLLEDGVGKVDGKALGQNVTGETAEGAMRRFYQVEAAKLARAEKQFFGDWSDGMGFIEKRQRTGEFFDTVGRYIRDPDSVSEPHDAVKKMAAQYQRFYSERLKLQQNPLADRGLEGRAVAGAEGIPQNPRYLPRLADDRKVRSLIERYSAERVEGLVAGAIRSAQPDLDEALVTKMGKGWVRRRMQNAYGLQEDPKFAFLSNDIDAIKATLKNDYDLSDADVTDVIAKLPKRENAGGKDAHFKQRIDLDEGFRTKLQPIFGGPAEDVHFNDLLVNDASKLTDIYNRRTAGRVAMARVRIKDPRAPSAPELPAGLSFKVGPSNRGGQLGPASKSNLVEIVDKDGNVHYRADMAHEEGGISSIGFVQNITREHRGLGAALYTKLAALAEQEKSRLVAGFNSSSHAKKLQADLEGRGLARRIEADTLSHDSDVLATLADKNLYEIKSEAPSLIIDGITKDSEFERLVTNMKRQAADMSKDGKQVDAETAEKNLKWAYQMILGRPDPSQIGAFADFSRFVRKFNFARLMNQMGFAQMQEISAIAGQTGMKAMFQQMPILRRIRDMDAGLVRKHGLEEELESVMGLGSEELRSDRFHRWDEYGADYRTGRSQFAHNVDNTLDAAGDVTRSISLFRYVNEYSQVWAARAAAQKFANLAGNPTKANLRRMASLGLDEGQLGKVLGQIKQHSSVEDGILFGNKLKRLNLDKWTITTPASPSRTHCSAGAVASSKRTTTAQWRDGCRTPARRCSSSSVRSSRTDGRSSSSITSTCTTRSPSGPSLAA